MLEIRRCWKRLLIYKAVAKKLKNFEIFYFFVRENFQIGFPIWVIRVMRVYFKLKHIIILSYLIVLDSNIILEYMLYIWVVEKNK